LTNKLDSLDIPQDFSQKRGALELYDPSREYTTSTRRQSDVRTPREIKERPIPQPSRRETRSQRALAKNLPYNSPSYFWGNANVRILEYPYNAVKNKITIFNDDLDRLNDDEFLNDTIIEFYLR